MTLDRHQKLIQILKEGDSKEIPFHQTKTSLLKQGYSESEINHAVYQSSYDGKKNPMQSENPVTKAYEKNPEIAEKIGKDILASAKQHERTKAIATGAAARFAPGRHAQSKYTFDFFELLGLPFFSILFGSIAVFLVVYKFNLPNIINYLFTTAISFWIAWAFYKRYLKK